jgi:DNA repair protein SbcC/Rad50
VNPLHLIARNYRSFDNLDVDLPDGCVAILGENGAGKSSIVNAVDLAIFGPASRSLSDALTEGVTDDDLLVELVFEHAGETYRVRRTVNPRGRGKSTLDFEVWEPEA